MRVPWIERSRKAALLITAVLMSAGYTAIGLVFVLLIVLAEGIVTRRPLWERSDGDLYLLSFIGIFLASGWVSSYRSIAVGSAGLAALTIFLAFGTLHRQLQHDPSFLEPFLWAWGIGGILSAAWALILHRLTGQPAFTPELNQNALGTTLLISLVLCMGLFIRSQNTYRYLLAVGCVIVVLGLAITTSRGAWIGALIGIVSLLWLTRRRLPTRQGLVLLVIGVVALILIGQERTDPVLVRRASTIVGQYQGRIALAKSAGAMLVDHPLLGTGLNTFSLLHRQYKFAGDVDAVPPYAHNIFFNMAAEGGVLGLAAFAAIIIWAGLRAWKWHRASGSRSEAILSATVLSAFLGGMVHQLFDSTFISVHLGSSLWFLIAIIATIPSVRAMLPTPFQDA